MADTNDVAPVDALNRGVLVENLGKLISSSTQCVIAIDGEWGSGKTWFGKQLRQWLEQRSAHTTIWVDSFEADWHDDPALSILAAFVQHVPKAKRARFLKSIAPLASGLFLATSKTGLRFIGGMTGIDSETVREYVDALHDAGDQYIEKRLKELTDRQQSRDALKKLLNEAVEDGGGKVVVFVDELDRCSPEFAIRFLERIKHLFAIRGVVFVLLWKRSQIQSAVKAFYGQYTDGQMYLDRFVDYPVLLPNHNLDGRVSGLGMIVESEVRARSGHAQRVLHDCNLLIGCFADLLDLTAREVIHLCSWWAMTPVRHNVAFELWLLCVKVKFPSLYSGLRSESIDAHRELEQRLSTAKRPGQFLEVFDSLQQFHHMCAAKDTSGSEKMLQVLFDGRQSNPFTMASRSILRIESMNS